MDERRELPCPAQCARCGRPTHPDNRCDFCGRLLCFMHADRFPLTDIPVLDDDYETMCEPCIGRECGVYYDLAALEDLTELPCGHSIVHLHIPDQGNAYCRECFARAGIVL